MTKKLPDKISIGHGSGGSMTRSLVKELFAKEFSNVLLDGLGDSAIIDLKSGNLAYTTDSYVVDPLFFPGGDIGKLSICGTVNDLSVAGADPKFISAGFIIEEGFSMNLLRKIVSSMASEARKAGVLIVTGDTKVVNNGKCDKLFINTSGIGILDKANSGIASGSGVRGGDNIIINGNIGDHSVAILTARSDIEMETNVKSDCATLNRMIAAVVHSVDGVRFMRDATRGGLATVLVELAEMTDKTIEIDEVSVPVGESVVGVCEVLGFDPLYLANEGKVVMVVSPECTNEAIKVMQSFPEGEGARIIGKVSDIPGGNVILNTLIGGSRVIDMLASDQLPRIC